MAVKFGSAILTLRVAWSLIIFLTPSINADVKCSEDGTEFMINVKYQWQRESDAAFPDQDPSIAAAFKPMTCVSHNENFVLWKIGEPAIPPLVNFFEAAAQYPNSGDPFKALDDTFSRFNSSTRISNQLQATKKSVFSGRNVFRQSNVSLPDIRENNRSGTNFESTTDPDGTLNITVTVDPHRPLISCFAMIWPSADWFVGISNVNVCNANNSFVVNDTTMFSYDAGIYNTPNYVTGSEAEKEPSRLHIQRVRIVAADGYGKLNVTEYSKINDRTENISNPACFPADELVTLRTGHVIRMEHLDVNHEVSFPSLIHPRRGSRVFAFSHRESAVIARFLRVRFIYANGVIRDLRLTPGHYIYRWQRSPSAISSRSSRPDVEAVPAISLQMGDVLVGATNDHPVVLSVNETISRGLYNPHTVHGDIFVKGVRVSCYTSAVPPVTASAFLSPFRVLYHLNLYRLSNSLLEYFSTLSRSIGAERLLSTTRR